MSERAVGVPSPWAMAEIAAGAPIDWAQVDEPNAVLKQVLGLSYSELIDPENSASPLWEGYDPAMAEKDIVSEEAVKRLQERLAQVYGGGCEPGRLWWERRGEYGTPAWHELKQGALADCGFLATMASILFAGQELPHRQAGDDHFFSFFSSEGEEEVVKTSSVLPRDIGPYHAVSRQSVDEVWPVLWEKAFECLLRPDCPQHKPIFCSIGHRQLTAIYTHLFGVGMELDTPQECLESLLAENTADGATSYVRVVRTDGTARRLTPNHAYSLLGTTKRSDGERAVVLNDPNGLRAEASSDPDTPPWAAPHTHGCGGCASGVVMVSESEFLANVSGGLSLHPDDVATRAGWD